MSKTAKANLNIFNLEFLSAFASSTELKDKMEKAELMLKQKAKENWGVEIGSDNWKEMIKMRTWVSRDPKMAEQIRQANDISRLVSGMVVEMDLTKDEIEGLLNRIEGMGGVDDMQRKLKDALNKL